MKKQALKSSCKVVFHLPKEAVEGAASVAVLGDFNNWKNEPLSVQKDGSFASILELPVGKDYHFRYLIDGQRWENDWDADRYETSPLHAHIENSVVCLSTVDTNGIIGNQAVVSATIAAKSVAVAPATLAAEKVIKETVAKQKTTKKATAKKKTVKKAIGKKADGTDDLTKIEGIGPKIAGLLTEAGIPTFEALSKTAVSKLEAILEAAGSRYRMHNPSTWAGQAKLAAAGEWEELKDWQGRLKGGRKV